MLSTLGAQPRGGRVRRRRPRPAEPAPAPRAVAIARATVVAAEPLDDPAGWLAGVDPGAEADRAVRVLNRLLHTHRVAAADAYVRDVRRDQALVVRVGTGAGERVADGRWDRAVELPPSMPPRRSAALHPQERLAAVLGGRDVSLACEELVLRARTDLTEQRWREAALQADVALRAALAELAAWRDVGDLGRRLDDLTALVPAVRDAASAALAGGVADAETEAVERAVDRLEAALRARSAHSF